MNAVKTDAMGYLQHLEDWSEAIAVQLATAEHLTLSEEHWVLIHWVRDFYHTYGRSPGIRVLVNALKQQYGPEKGNSLYVQSLFPQAAKQLSKIAGLPKPVHCT